MKEKIVKISDKLSLRFIIDSVMVREVRYPTCKYFIIRNGRENTKYVWYHKFTNKENMDSKINDEIKTQKYLAQKKIESQTNREKMKKQNLSEYKVGTVLYSTRGYEQTNVDFYQIIEKKGNTVFIKGIQKKITRKDTDMSGYVTYCKDNFIKTNTAPDSKHLIGADGIKVSGHFASPVGNKKEFFYSTRG